MMIIPVVEVYKAFFLADWPMQLRQCCRPCFSLYTTPGHMDFASDLMCSTSLHIQPTCMPMKYFAFMPNSACIFVSGT